MGTPKLLTVSAALCLLLLAPLAAEDLAPGTHRGLVCPSDAGETYDLFLPKSYATKATLRFPVLFVSDAGGKPNFHGLESWAEQQDVVMVTINGSRNGPWEPIHKAQKAVTDAVFSQYRIHPSLRFSMGCSGGGWASWVLASKFGDDWGGVVTCCSGPVTLNLTNKTVLIYYFVGTEDKTYPFARAKQDFQKDTAAGFTLRWMQRDGGGHIWANTQELTTMLNWMLSYQRLAHPRLTPAERKESLAAVLQRSQELAAIADAQQRRQACEEILGIEPIQKLPELKPLREIWLKSVLATTVAQSDPIVRARNLEAALASPMAEGVTGDVRTTATKQLADLRRDPAVKADGESRAALVQVQAAEQKAGNNKTKLKQVMEYYVGIAKRWPNTAAGQEAKAAALRLSGTK